MQLLSCFSCFSRLLSVCLFIYQFIYHLSYLSIYFPPIFIFQKESMMAYKKRQNMLGYQENE